MNIKILFSFIIIIIIIYMGNSQYQTFRKRYQTISFIAQGAFGKVYKVKDEQQNIIKAEKLSKNPIKPSDRQKFIEQVNLIKNLQHPNIIKGYEYIIQYQSDKMDKTLKNQYLHIIMQYFEGKQLKDYLGKLTQQQVVKIYMQLRSAVLYLQKKKIVHRDISLDNILLNQQMEVKITDFGIASELKQINYYETEFRKGKQSYKAPQVWNCKVSMNSDLWALGIVILQLYFGSEISKLYKKKPGDCEQFPTEFYEIKKGKIPQEIMRIVQPLLQRDHNKRKFYDGDEQDDDEEGEDRVIIFKDIKTDKKIKKKMTKLRLDDNNIGTEGAVEIAKNLKNLTWLSLNSNNIGIEGVVEIAKNLKNLTKLWLNDNNIGIEGASVIAKNLKNLTKLWLKKNNIETEGAVEIAKNLKNLTKLYLYSNKIGTDGAVEIAKNLKNLTQLDLSFNNIGTEGTVEIAKNLKNLTVLSLNDNNIGTDGAVEIAKNLKNLTVLWLIDNNIVTEGAVEIAKNLKNLTQLSLSGNNIGTKAAVEIAKNLNNLTVLSLSWNNIGTEGAVEIAKNLKNLKQLRLNSNNIGTEGAVEIVKKLKNLTLLSLGDNKIDEQGKKTIRSFIKDRNVYL